MPVKGGVSNSQYFTLQPFRRLSALPNVRCGRLTAASKMEEFVPVTFIRDLKNDAEKELWSGVSFFSAQRPDSHEALGALERELATSDRRRIWEAFGTWEALMIGRFQETAGADFITGMVEFVFLRIDAIHEFEVE